MSHQYLCLSSQALGIADMSFFGIRFLLLSGLFVYVAIRETRNLKEVRARRLKSS